MPLLQTVNAFEGDAQHTRWNQVAIVKFDWLTARKLATSNPQQLTATQPWKQPNGDIMTNEQTIHAQLKQAHENKLGTPQHRVEAAPFYLGHRS